VANEKENSGKGSATSLYGLTMRRILLIPTVASAFFFISAASTKPCKNQADGQRNDKCYGICFYAKVLDRVFPREAFDGREELRLITFRVLPTRRAEWQVVICEKHDGKFKVVYYDSPKEGNIWSYIGEMNPRQEEPDLESIVHGLHIDVKTIDAAPTVLETKIHSFLGAGIPANLETDAVLDGAQYELWEETVSNSIHVSITDNEPFPGAKLPPIARWMVEITNLAKAVPNPPSTQSPPKH
jgi:hypothetical protein